MNKTLILGGSTMNSRILDKAAFDPKHIVSKISFLVIDLSVFLNLLDFSTTPLNYIKKT